MWSLYLPTVSAWVVSGFSGRFLPHSKKCIEGGLDLYIFKVVEMKMFSFSFAVTRMERIKNEEMRGTEQIRCCRDKFREV